MVSPATRPRIRADTFGWSRPSSSAALTCVSCFAAIRSRMRRTNSALASARSGCGKSRSANTLPLPASTRAAPSAAVLDAFLLFDPLRIVPLRILQACPDPLDDPGRGLDPRLRLLLEGMEHVHDTGELDSVHRPVGTPVVVLDHFKHTRPAEPLEGL